MSEWTDYLVDLGRNPHTIYEYERRLRLWEEWLAARGKQPLEAKQADVIAWQLELIRGGNGPRTVNGKLSAVSLYYSWLLLMERIDETPVPSGLSLHVVAPRIPRLSDEELRNILAWFDTLRPNVRAAFWTMFGTGARVSEVARLQYHDIIFQNEGVWIRISDAKWGSDRTIPVIDSKAAKILYEYWREQSIDGKPIFKVSKRTIQEYATHYSQESGVHFHSHLLRHTFAARLLEQGVAMTQIQFLLGHRSLAMTAHYTESAIVDTTRLAPPIMQEYGEGDSTTTQTPRLRPPDPEEE